MNVQVVGCSHHGTSIEMRERLAFSPEQTREALDHWRRVFPGVEAVLLSTCNRVEFFVATENTEPPTFEQIAQFLARFHGIEYDWFDKRTIFVARQVGYLGGGL